eukprot:PhF_6_TR2547/c0_g1_i1/m.4325/K17278/PGRMC1_2; membrane-associated progesterone receptor component
MQSVLPDTTTGQIIFGVTAGLIGITALHLFNEWTSSRTVTTTSPSTAKSLRGFTKEDLRQFNGENGRPVYMSVKRRVYSVAPHFYGVGGPYEVFAAKDASRNLGKSLVSDTEADADWTTLSDEHIAVLNDWDEKFRVKYETVGWYIPDDEYFTRGQTLEP